MLARLCHTTHRCFYHRRHLPLLCLVLLLLSLAATPGRAQDAATPLPNGELIFEAVFSKNLDGLSGVYGPKWMDARSDDGALRLAALAADGFVVAVVDDFTFGDLAAEVDVFPTTSLPGQDFGILLRGQNPQAGLDKFYLVAVEPSDAEVHFDLWTSEGNWEYLYTKPLPADLWRLDAFNTLRVEVVGDSFRAFLNDVFVLAASDSSLAAPGVLGLVTSAPIDMADGDEAVARYDNLRVYQVSAPTPGAKSERLPTAKGDKAAAEIPSSEETVILFDSFDDPTSGWTTGESESGEVFYADGELHLVNRTDAAGRTTSWRGLNLTDVVVAYSSRWVDGDPDNWHTLLCRGDGNSAISASYSADGYYGAGVFVDGERVRELAPPTPSDAILQGTDAVNTVSLMCIGNQIIFSVNGVQLVAATDDRLISGDIGLAASALGGEFTEIAFDEMVLSGTITNDAGVGGPTPLESTPAALELPAEPVQTATATVTASGLNVRSGAGSSFEQVDRVAAGDVLNVLARNDGCTWVQIITPRAVGWVSASYVRLNVDCTDLPLAEDAEPVAATAPAVVATATTPSATAAVAPTPAATAAAPAITAGPALITDFEVFGAWRRGDEGWGEFTQSGEKYISGSRAGKLTYDFPAAVPEGRNYVVFLRSLPISGQPDALTLWVHGDGSGNFLNVWVRDAREQVWQFSFGQIEHNAWRQLTAALDTDLGWPVQRISGSGGNALTYPLRLEALVLDYPTDEAAAGVIYVDDLETVEE